MVDGTTVAKGDGKGQAGLALGVESVAGRDTRGDAPPSVGKVLESAQGLGLTISDPSATRKGLERRPIPSRPGS